MSKGIKSRKEYYSRVRKVIDAVHERAGLSVFVSPFLHEIKCTLWPPQTDEDIVVLDFDTFFSRIPPFEPISIFESRYKSKDLVIKLKGDYVWFVTAIKGLKNKDKLKEAFKEFQQHLNQEYDEKVRCEDVICGIYEDLGDKIVLKEVIIPRVLSDGKPLLYKELELELRSGEPSIRIYYGLHKIAKKIRRPLKRSEIPEILNAYISPLEKERGYSPFTLNYVTTCYDGYVITTDPTSLGKTCDPCEEERKRTLLCKEYYGRGIYEWRRKIFPKVYSKISVEPSHTIHSVLDEVYLMPYVFITINNVHMSKDVNSFTMYLEKVGKIELQLEKKISTGHFSTNALLVAFDRSLIDAFIDILKVNKSNISLTIKLRPNGNNIYMPLYYLLISKYLWYNVFNNNLRPDLKIDKNNERFILSIEASRRPVHYNIEKIEKFAEEFIERDIEEFNRLREFTAEVVAHTLAHVIHTIAVNRVPEIQAYIDYFYSITDKYILAGVYENTKNGMLGASREIASRLSREISSVKAGVSKLSPKALKEVIEEVITSSPISIEPTSTEKEDVQEALKNIAIIVADKVASKTQRSVDIDFTNKVYEVINKFYALLSNTVNSMIHSNIYIDSQIFIYVILWHIVRKLDDLASYLGSKVKLDQRVVRDVLEELFEAELYKILIEMLFPNMCMDGCGFDLQVPDCHSALEQPFVISRSLLLAFLEFLGTSIEGLERANLSISRIDCTGDQLRDFSFLARRSIYVLTSEISEETVHLIRQLLEKNRELKMTLEMDKRLLTSKPDLVERLRSLELEDAFHGRFKLKVTEEPHHGKMIELDNLRIYTSWNFGTSIKPLQTYKAELRVGL
jgi:hypothetical protein